MSVFVEVLRELSKMFFGEPRLSIAILVVVALAATGAHHVGPLATAAILLIGCLAILAESVLRGARQRRA